VERRTLRRLTAAAVVLGVLGVAGWAWARRTRDGGPIASIGAQRADAPRPIVPAGVRIRVEVVNTTTTRGLARKATFHLRDLGFDVVSIRTTRDHLDSTLVVDYGGKADWAKLLSSAMSNARVETRPDTSRYVDLTVLIGASWRPPAQPFYP
jgi:hypothetical protein